jgi:alkylation response protein AidB-like acyl-CoA dehydrogenase
MTNSQDSEEQQFVESVRRFLSTEWPFEKRISGTAKADNLLREQWQGFAELGWLGLPISEDFGGLGLPQRFVRLLMEELGAALISSPYIPTVVVAAAAIELAGSAEARAELLPRIANGELLVGFANDEFGNLRDPLRIETRATRSGDAYTISGQKSAVAFGDVSELLLVSAQVDGAAGEQSGIGLFLVDRDDPGITVETFKGFDDATHSVVTLKGARVAAHRVIGTPGKAGELLDMLINRAAAAISAEAVGSMRSVLQLTTEYLKTRHQFGKPLGSNQALQHRLVDMFMTCEVARSLVELAFDAIEMPAQHSEPKAVSAAKARIGRDALAVAKEGINLHGGIGLSKEYSVGHHLRRAVVLNQSYGDTHWHRRRYESLSV